MSMEQKDIAGLRALAEKATPGPWYECGLPWFQNGYGVMAGSPDPHVGYIIADTETWEGDRAEYLENDGPVKNLAGPDTDAAFIAACDPQTIISLLDALTELSSTLAQAEARVKELEGAHGPWSDDFKALESNRRPFLVYATDDDGFAYGLGAWVRRDGPERILVWGNAPYRPINDGIERALLWAPIIYPGFDRLDATARALLRSQEPASGEAGTDV